MSGGCTVSAARSPRPGGMGFLADERCPCNLGDARGSCRASERVGLCRASRIGPCGPPVRRRIPGFGRGRAAVPCTPITAWPTSIYPSSRPSGSDHGTRRLQRSPRLSRYPRSKSPPFRRTDFIRAVCRASVSATSAEVPGWSWSAGPPPRPGTSHARLAVRVRGGSRPDRTNRCSEVQWIAPIASSRRVVQSTLIRIFSP